MAAFSSRAITARAKASASSTGPCTCGMQRSAYASCTRGSFSRCDSRISLSASRSRSSAADAACPTWPRASWMRSSKATGVPSSASSDIAPATCATRQSRCASRERERRDRRVRLRAVDEREPFLRLQRERREPRGARASSAAGAARRRRDAASLRRSATARDARAARDRRSRRRSPAPAPADTARRSASRRAARRDRGARRRYPFAITFARSSIIARTSRSGSSGADAGRVAAHEVHLQLGEPLRRDRDVATACRSRW